MLFAITESWHQRMPQKPNDVFNYIPPTNAGTADRLILRRPLAGCDVCFRNIVLYFTLLFVVPSVYADFNWFEQHWISDGPRTIEANEELTSNWSADQIETFQSIFGKMEWHVADGLVSVLIANTKMDLVYSYRPSQDNELELLMENGEVIPLTKTNAGFCVTFKTPASSTGVVNECYRPVKDVSHGS